MQVTSHSPQETLKLGRVIAACLRPKDIICLFGGLGAGKTVLTKGIGQGLGVAGRKVSSPSFILLRTYAKGRLSLYHFDFYRLKSAEAVASTGFEEYFYCEGACVIEWAQRMGHLLPQEFLKIELLIKGRNRRLLKFTPFGQRYREILSSLRAKSALGPRLRREASGGAK